jgi:hypothetical protein
VGCKTAFWSHESCDKGLIPVPNKDPKFCVHPYESTITPEGESVSMEGVLPETNVSLHDAMAACESTVVNGQRMRLIRYDEWLMAGDVNLDKGELFPWREKDDSRCVITTPDTRGSWTEVQPTGTMPDCRSRWGVYDQIGNVWEWVDLQQTASRQSWTAFTAEAGFEPIVTESSIQISDRLLSRLRLQSICVQHGRLTIGVNGLQLHNPTQISLGCADNIQGYLWVNVSNEPILQQTLPTSGSLLPVKIEDGLVVWDKDRDEEPVGAKVGGAFYSGGESTIPAFWVGHTADFDGTIGFRCSVDPSG